MLFNSVHFLIFFPVVTLIYFVLPHRFRWVWLLAASYYFYMAWNPRYALLMLFSTVITYLGGLGIAAAKAPAAKKLWVAFSFVVNLAILFFFKYFDFALGNLNALLSAVGLTALNPEFDVLLPVGISFYTFQALGYTVDVYRGDVKAERNLGIYALFVSFFPQLVAGPIERSANLLPQLRKRHYFRASRALRGLVRMMWGLFLKLVIADRAALLVNTVYGNHQDYAGLQLVLATLVFAVQIYCDFGGYTNIAIGAAGVMGFELMENFRQPYFSRSIREFWKRWHISLSSWFRDYLYIPLGGSRKGKLRTCFNKMLTFVASGLWHGASWGYVIWGGLHGLYQIAGDLLRPAKERLFAKLKVRRDTFSWKLGQTLVTFVLVCFAWIFFRAPGAGAAFEIIASMFSTFNYWVLFDVTLFEMGLDRQQFIILMFAVLTLVVVDYMDRKKDLAGLLIRQSAWFRWVVNAALVFSVVIFGVYGNEYAQSQFIYFQF